MFEESGAGGVSHEGIVKEGQVGDKTLLGRGRGMGAGDSATLVQ